ncbi:MAG: mannan chain length control protein LmeA [Mycobacteriaceae bacterium]|nr:mannan chain length control protein LmeA [Mycobacteriaceae bacterium]
MHMRKVPIAVAGAAILVATVVVGLVGAVGVDFGTCIYAEYRLSRTVRQTANLHSDPFVAILGFPFLTQARRGHYTMVEIKANGVEHAMVGQATLEATMHSVNLADSSWLIKPDAKLPIGGLESRIIIDSIHLGRYLGISDLMVEAPPTETNNATGGSTDSGISSSRGLVFTGTPNSAHFDKRVSVSVDLSIADTTTLVLTPTEVLTGPETANQHVPVEQRDAVLRAFSGRLTDQKLPFGLIPTSKGARGSDVIIEGITEDITVTLNEFRQ